MRSFKSSPTVTALAAAALMLAGCLTETKTEEKLVVVGGADTALLAREGVALKLCFQGRFKADTLRSGRAYATDSGEVVRFETAKFYVSEIALVDSNGVSHYLAGTHLVDMLDSAAVARGYAIVNLKALPGRYRGLRFSVGVPYDENHRDAATQAAPLGTASGMFWGWNSGYIFHRTEGKVDSAGVEKAFAYHVGGDNRRQQVSLYSLSGTLSNLVVEAGHAHKIAAPAEGLAKTAHEPDNHIAVKASYDMLFAAGLASGKALRPSLNVNERQAHGGAIADRLFLNTQSVFTLVAH